MVLYSSNLQLIFIHLIPQPMRTFTLIPYTTLFRSKFEPEIHSSMHFLDFLRLKIEFSHKPLQIVPEIFDLDRKSTRLNSSHVAISYAVFRLKKKIRNI